jgi:hypothetical protein
MSHYIIMHTTFGSYEASIHLLLKVNHIRQIYIHGIPYYLKCLLGSYFYLRLVLLIRVSSP